MNIQQLAHSRTQWLWQRTKPTGSVIWDLTTAPKIEDNIKWTITRNCTPVYIIEIEWPACCTVKYLGLHLQQVDMKEETSYEELYEQLYWLLREEIQNDILIKDIYKVIIIPIWTYGIEGIPNKILRAWIFRQIFSLRKTSSSQDLKIITWAYRKLTHFWLSTKINKKNDPNKTIQWIFIFLKLLSVSWRYKITRITPVAEINKQQQCYICIQIILEFNAFIHTQINDAQDG